MRQDVPTSGNLLEDLVDCLEIDLHNTHEKYENSANEVNRLREHLVQLDSELTEEGLKRDHLLERFKERTVELQGEVAFWRQKCVDYEQRSTGQDIDESDDEILHKIDRVTDELELAQKACEYERQRSADLLQSLNDRDREICDLQSALSELEAAKRKEIEISLAESKEKLACSKTLIDRLNVELEDVRAASHAVPDLKRKIAELDIQVEALTIDKTEQITDLIDKELVANLFVNLFDRSRSIDRRQVADMLCTILSISQDDQQRMGLILSEDDPPITFADQWIAFLTRK